MEKGKEKREKWKVKSEEKKRGKSPNAGLSCNFILLFS
jgi:hypothetical protein